MQSTSSRLGTEGVFVRGVVTPKQGAQLWHFSLATGRIDRGPAVAGPFSSQFPVAPSMAAEALAGDNLMIGETLQPVFAQGQQLSIALPISLAPLPLQHALIDQSLQRV